MIYLQNIQPTNLLNLNVKQKYLILGSNEKSITLKSTGLPILLYRPRSTPLLYISHTGFCCRNKLIFSRSEERRVGKESRTRLSRCRRAKKDPHVNCTKKI